MSEHCARCSFDYGTPLLESLRIVDQLPGRARGLLDRAGEHAGQRPDPATWSPVGYVWHLADILRMGAEWLHDMRVHDYPTHHAPDNDKTGEARGYDFVSADTGLWSLEQSCGLLIGEAAVTDPARTCAYFDWRDVTAGEVVTFMAHEAYHHAFDIERQVGAGEASHAG